MWGVCGICLGLWELAAFTTRRVPTVSRTVACARHRWPYLTGTLVVGWAAGTAAHLLRHER